MRLTGHTLNLGVQAALKEPHLTIILARCRKIVQHFNKSCLDSEQAGSIWSSYTQLTHEVTTRLNLTHDIIIIRMCEQQPAIVAVLIVDVIYFILRQVCMY